MRELWFILALVLLVIWDLSRNHGRIIGTASALLLHLLRLVGVWHYFFWAWRVFTTR